MTRANGGQGPIEAVRQGAMALLADLVERAAAFDLPEPPPALAEYQKKLAENSYNVLIVGEAKRGKSSFANALIGRDLLPTDVDIATSQVFRIQQAEREAYRLRFEDGTMQAIDRDDLPRYGSQEFADSHGGPRLDQMVRWIEVDAPIRFLPPGLALLDTPGMGSLYAPHTQVTQRLLPYADAVIFVLDSGQVVGEPDLKLIESILTVTRGIFFIQTKIDLHRTASWQEMQRRNEQILAERFQDRLVDTRIWPISSHNLRKAAQTGDDDYVVVSRQKEMAAALQGFLFRVAGWARVADAIEIADYYHQAARATLAERLAVLSESSAAERQARAQEAAQRKQEFEHDWGIRGTKRRELTDGIRREIAIGKQSFSHALKSSGDISLAQEARIDAVQTIQDAEKLAQEMGNEFVAAALQAWQQVCNQVHGRCMELLGDLAEAADALQSPATPDRDEILQRTRPLATIAADRYALVKGAKMEFGTATGIVVLVAQFGILAPPVALAAFVGVGAWAVVRGWKTSQQQQVRNAQAELKRHLSSISQQLQRHFFDVELSANRLSRVDEYFTAAERSLTAAAESLATRRAAEAQAELARLEDAVQMDDRERQSAVEQSTQRLTAWERRGPLVASLAADLIVLDKAIGVAPKPTPERIPS